MNASAEIPAAEYKLFVRKGQPRFYLRNTDEGIYLSEKGVGWFFDGVSYTRDWSELAAVNPYVAYVPKNGQNAVCKITFRDGSVLSVLSASKWGSSDDERNTEYGRFLTDLHAAIPREFRDKIRFETGFGANQHIGMKIVLVFAAALFVGLPLGLTLYFRDWQALLATCAGLGFVAPLYSMARRGKPATYHPDHVPEDQFP